MLYRTVVCCTDRSNPKTLWINLLAFKFFSFFLFVFILLPFRTFIIYEYCTVCARWWLHSIVFGPLFPECIERKENLLIEVLSSLTLSSSLWMCVVRVHLLTIPVMVFRICSVYKSNTLNRLSVPLWCCHQRRRSSHRLSIVVARFSFFCVNFLFLLRFCSFEKCIFFY